MHRPTASARLPKIAVTDRDHESLSVLANAALKAFPDVADELLGELERARIVPERSIKPTVVRMGSVLTYRTPGGADRTMTLVYPAQADISLGRVSVLTPIGTALIGLSEGQSIEWTDRAGKRHVLTVVTVGAPNA